MTISKKLVSLLSALAAVLAFFPLVAQGQITGLYLETTANTSVGKISEKLTPQTNYSFQYSGYADPSEFIVFITENPPHPNFDLSFDRIIGFSVAGKKPFQVGHYDNLLVLGNYNANGFYLAANGGSIFLTFGYFDVLEAVYDNQSNLTAFAVDFNLNESLHPFPSLIKGSIRFDSSIGFPDTAISAVPELSTYGAFSSFFLFAIIYSRRRFQLKQLS
jgi:hypothetical protein